MQQLDMGLAQESKEKIADTASSAESKLIEFRTGRLIVGNCVDVMRT